MSEDGEHQMFQDKQFSAAGETSNEDLGEGRTLTCSIEIIYGVLIPECDKARKVSPGMCRKVCLIHADSSSRSDNQSSGEPGSGGRCCWLSGLVPA